MNSLVFIKSVFRKINLEKKNRLLFKKKKNKVHYPTQGQHSDIEIILYLHTYLTTLRSRNQVNVFIASCIEKLILNAQNGLGTHIFVIKSR